MATAPQVWTEKTVEVAGTKLQLVSGGRGKPLLLLHDELGPAGWLRFHEALAKHYTLYLPSHPGFGKSEQLNWIMGMRDMAGWYLQALDELDLGQVNVVGLSLGGWLAAEMAAMCPHHFSRMVLVDSPGILPLSGEIFDMFMTVPRDYITRSVFDAAATPEFQTVCPDQPTPEQVEAWETAREGSSRLAWKPYMHDPNLPHLLRRLKTLPTLIVWGREDAVVPVSVGEVYHASIQGSRLTLLDNCGHRPELEVPEELAELVRQFLSDP